MKAIKFLIPAAAFSFALVAAVAGNSSNVAVIDAYTFSAVCPTNRTAQCNEIAGAPACKIGTVNLYKKSGTPVNCQTQIFGTLVQ